MVKKFVLFFFAFVFLTSCTTIGKISHVDLTSTVGIEFRKVEGPDFNTRTTTNPGLKISTTREFSFHIEYIFRSVNFGGYDLEHGVFFSTSVPLWRKRQQTP